MNLAALATRGRRLAEQAIMTSGTRVTIARDSDDLDSTVDFDTLAVEDATPAAPVQVDVPILLVASGDTDTEVGPERALATTTFRGLMRITVANVQQGDTLIVTATADPRLSGATLLVTAVTDDPLGIIRTVIARRI